MSISATRGHGGTAPGTWVVRTPSLSVDLEVGRRRAVGWALRAVPSPIVTSTLFATAADPLARILLRGVRTRGIARPGRREWYSATDLHTITELSGTFDGEDLGKLAPVDPPCTFGFSSTPRHPGVTAVVTTIDTSP